jgi:secreted trypsin-like serine protease
VPALAVLLAFLVLAAPAAAMSGGRDTPIAEAPFVVSLGHCTGSLIAPDRVLTAAHCVDGFDPGTFEVVVGADPRVTPDAPSHAVRGFSVARGYKLSFPFSHRTALSAIAVDDVALVLLAAPVPGAATIPVAAPQDRVDGAGAAVTVYGYGLTEEPAPPHPPPPPQPLQSGGMSAISRAACAREYPRAIDAAMLCTDDRGPRPLTQPCSGDSGGPVVVTTPSGPVQVGVTSWGAEVMDGGCGEKRLPSVAMRVSSYRDLITAADPTIAPFPEGDVSLDGAVRVGRRVTCRAPDFGGDRARLRYRWATSRIGGPIFPDNAAGVLRRIRGASGATLRIRRALAGRRVVCEVRASNPGGRASAYSDPVRVPAA